MRKGQDRKVKVARSSLALAGRAGCLGLLALGLALVNPVGCLSAFAEGEGNVEEEVAEETSSEDYAIDTQVLTASTVGISFSPVAGTAVAPVGVPTKFQVTATVDVEHSGGYTIYFGSNSQNLTRVGGTETIAPITGSVDFDNLENDTWGYALAEGTTVPDTATYTAVPGSVKGRAVYTNNSTKILKESKTYTLSFAARIGTSKPAGTYQNEVTMSVVSSPAQLALADISEMQQMTSDICENTATNASKQLKDVRDGKYYWVSKLADGKCWMTQNLDLDIPASGFPDESVATNNMTWQNSDMTAAWTDPTAGTLTTLPKLRGNAVDSYSWDQGLYVYTSPESIANCNGGASGAEGLNYDKCKSAFQKVDNTWTASADLRFTEHNSNSPIDTTNKVYDAHYLVGNWYQWRTATAGSGSPDIVSSAATEAGVANATSSICPKGWRLPTSGSTDADEPFNQTNSFGALLKAYGFTSDITSNELTKYPFFFVRSGYANAAGGYLSTSGSRAYYWSSTAYTDAVRAYILVFVEDGVSPSSADYRHSGFSVRCIAR